MQLNRTLETQVSRRNLSDRISQPIRFTPRRILIIMLLPVGDALFTQPALAKLRHHYPNATITALTNPIIAPLLKTSGYFDNLIIWKGANFRETMCSLIHSMLIIYRRRFDLLISLNPGGNWLGLLTGIWRQARLPLPLASWMIGTHRTTYWQRHAIEHYWNAFAPLGISPATTADHIPEWQIPPEDNIAARTLLVKHGLIPSPEHPLIVLHPGAEGFGQSKRWPATSFGELAHQLIERDGCQIAIIGGSGDREAAEVIQHATNGRAISLVGTLSLNLSCAVIAQAQGYIGADSGPLHFAIALGIPSIALYGISSLRQFGPRCADDRLLRIILPEPIRSPLGYFIGTKSLLDRPNYTGDQRMATIPVYRVHQAITSLLFYDPDQ
jgi:ADP-heptose:LPS heptosyltransferase